VPNEDSVLRETEYPVPPHRGPHRPPHRPHEHLWIYSAEGIVSPAQAGEVLARLASEISESGSVELGGEQVMLPEQLRAVVRHEVLPRGEHVVKVELIWDGPNGNTGHPIAELLN
jgi:hypothetical protein